MGYFVVISERKPTCERRLRLGRFWGKCPQVFPRSHDDKTAIRMQSCERMPLLLSLCLVCFRLGLVPLGPLLTLHLRQRRLKDLGH